MLQATKNKQIRQADRWKDRQAERQIIIIFNKEPGFVCVQRHVKAISKNALTLPNNGTEFLTFAEMAPNN